MSVVPALDEAIETWLLYLSDMNMSAHTLRSYRNALLRLRAWLEAQPQPIDLPRADASAAQPLTLALLTHYVQDLKRDRLQYATLRAYIGIIVDWLADLVDRGVISGVPNERGQIYKPDGVRKALMHLVTKPRVQQQAPRVPSLLRLPAYYPDQIAAWTRANGTPALTGSLDARGRTYLNLLRNAALIATLFCTGGRIAEVLSLDVADVQRRASIMSTARIVGKGNKERIVALDGLARDWLGRYLAARDTLPAAALPHTDRQRPIFVSHGPHKPGHRLTQFSAWRIVRDAADALADIRTQEGADHDEIEALRQVSPHTFRHFVGQALLDEGADIKTVAEYLGHSSTVVTERVYARPDPQRVIEEVDTFGPRASRSFRTPDRSADE